MLGYAGFMVQRSLNHNFQKFAGKILPSAIESVKMKANMDQIMEYSRLYELTGNGEHKWKAWNAFNAVDQNLSIYIINSKGHLPDSLIQSIQANVKLFLQYSSSYLQTDKVKNPGALEEYKNLMTIQELKITSILKRLIDKDVVNTKKTETILEEKTKLSFILILSALSFSILIFIIALIVTYISIVRPIRILARTAKIIGTGNIDEKLPANILTKKDEIGILANSFDNMVKYLIDLSNSMNDLNIEVNEEIEKKGQIIEQTEKLRKFKEKTENSPTKQSSLITTFSDDLMTPLNGILGFAELLKQDALPPEKKTLFINQIKDNALSLSHLVEDIADIAKIETGKFKILKTAFSLVDFFKDLNTLENTEKQRFPDHEVQIKFSIDQSVNLIFTDKYRLKQIFKKLIENAVKFTEKGTIIIGNEYAKTDNRIIFFVKDSGIGISDSDRNQMFEKFRYHTRKDGSNLGFGLAVCKGIVEELNGEIWIESFKEGGTQVFFKLDFEIPENDQSWYNSSNFNWKNKVFLVVDDEDIHRLILKRTLENNGYVILAAANGAEGLEIMRTLKVDLAIVDLEMPVMDGMEATRIIRQEISKTLPMRIIR